MLHIISMFTFPSDPSSLLFWRFPKTLIFALRFESVIHIYKMKIHVFEAISCLQNGKNTFSKAVSCYKMKKQAFEVFFTFTKRKHDLIWSDFMLMKWKTRFWSVFHVYNIKTRFWSAIHIYKAALFHVYKTKITFLKRSSCLQNGKEPFGSIFHVYKMEKHIFEVFSCL